MASAFGGLGARFHAKPDDPSILNLFWVLNPQYTGVFLRFKAHRVSATDGQVRAYSGGKLVLQIDPEIEHGHISMNG